MITLNNNPALRAARERGENTKGAAAAAGDQ